MTDVVDFDYELPEHLIAQAPAERREGSRLLVLDRTTGTIRHRRFADLPGELRRGDLLVLNDTKVLPVRLAGSKDTGGRVEVLLVERLGGDDAEPLWRALVRASRPPHPGSRATLEGGIEARFEAREASSWTVRLVHASGDPWRVVEQRGRMPLPPYIHRAPEDPRDALDRERYQTVFARRPGAVAAPTAGLHFTREILESLPAHGIETASLTLHVGIGTFLPVRSRVVEDHAMHDEAFTVPEETAVAIEGARCRGGRVVAVGTTVVRALESCASSEGRVAAGSGRTALFIRPGFRFRVVDALLTNFHLPRSTLLMLVAAFAGRERVLAAYAEAIRERYRFFSYGDAMLVTAP